MDLIIAMPIFGATIWLLTLAYDADKRVRMFPTVVAVLLFAGGSSGHLMAMDAANGKVLWHSGLVQQMSNTPITYMLDGSQYVLVAAGDTLYAFSIQR